MNSSIRVLVVDDHMLMRLGLVEAIVSEPGFELAGEAENGEEALSLFRANQPDVVTMDFRLPGADGAEVIERLRAEFPEARVIVLSVFEEEETIWRAVQAGAMGYLPKSARTREVLLAIRQVYEDKTYFPPAIAAKLAARQSAPRLSEGEFEVLREVVAGRTNKEIASKLHVSGSTVKARIQNLLDKLGVADRTQAAIEAVRRGLIRIA